MWIGVDPGGKDAFGLAILNDDGRFSTHCFSCADEAIKHLGERPAGIGIDAPMWWSSGPSGDRKKVASASLISGNTSSASETSVPALVGITAEISDGYVSLQNVLAADTACW